MRYISDVRKKMKKLDNFSFIAYINNIHLPALQSILKDLRALGFRLNYLSKNALFLKVDADRVGQINWLIENISFGYNLKISNSFFILVAIIINTNIMSPIHFLKMFSKGGDLSLLDVDDNNVLIKLLCSNNILECNPVSLYLPHHPGTMFVHRMLKQD
jgi:hypothetical protein